MAFARSFSAAHARLLLAQPRCALLGAKTAIACTHLICLLSLIWLERGLRVTAFRVALLRHYGLSNLAFILPHYAQAVRIRTYVAPRTRALAFSRRAVFCTAAYAATRRAAYATPALPWRPP